MNATACLIQKAPTACGPGEFSVAVKQNTIHSTYKELSPTQKKLSVVHQGNKKVVANIFVEYYVKMDDLNNRKH